MKTSVILVLALILPSLSLAANFCGRDFGNSKKCTTPCPRGVDSECPSGERCFAGVNCPSGGGGPPPGNHCGRSYGGSSKCRTRCPGGMDRECPSGERCFANVQCSTGGGFPPSGGGSSSSGFVVSSAQFSRMFPNRNSFYTYQALVSSAASFSGFTTTGSREVQLREAAAFLANIAHESGDLRFTRELNTANWNSYCDPNTATSTGFSADCRKNGNLFQYYGRGPIQLSWNFNYRAVGSAFNIDLLHNPDLVATDSKIAWRTAIWFWITRRGAGTLTPHNAITTGRGFGETIRSINGALECGGGRPDQVSARVSTYQNFVSILGTTVGPGAIRC